MTTDGWEQFATTVGELKAALADVPDHTPVILEKDAEGNGYSPLAGVYLNHVYEPETTWSGQTYNIEPDDDDPDEYRPTDGVRVVVLGPVN